MQNSYSNCFVTIENKIQFYLIKTIEKYYFVLVTLYTVIGQCNEGKWQTSSFFLRHPIAPFRNTVANDVAAIRVAFPLFHCLRTFFGFSTNNYRHCCCRLRDSITTCRVRVIWPLGLPRKLRSTVAAGFNWFGN